MSNVEYMWLVKKSGRYVQKIVNSQYEWVYDINKAHRYLTQRDADFIAKRCNGFAVLCKVTNEGVFEGE